MSEQNGFAFIAVGRPESAGCYCKINSYLKDVIQMLSENFDYVVIDGEAGIEQINRRVMEKVTHLVLITDASRKGIQVVQTIKGVADRLVMYDKMGVIVNRIPGPEAKNLVDTGVLPVLAYIQSDDQLAKFDLLGENVFFLPDEAEIVRGAAELWRLWELSKQERNSERFKTFILLRKLIRRGEQRLGQRRSAAGRHRHRQRLPLIPEVLLNLPGTFAVRLRAPRTGSIEMGTYYMTSLLCEGCRAYLESLRGRIRIF